MKLSLTVFAILAVSLVASACQNDAALRSYRDTLHKVDATIYEDYAAFINEAEANHTRSPDVIWTNRRTIQQAEQIYQSGAKLQGLGQPATQPSSSRDMPLLDTHAAAGEAVPLSPENAAARTLVSLQKSPPRP